MRLMLVGRAYDGYLRDFSQSRADEATLGFDQLRALFYADAFGTSDARTASLEALGYETFATVANYEPLQRAWAREHGLDAVDRHWALQIVVAQARHFRPDVVWLNASDRDLVRALRNGVPGLRLIFQSIGGAIDPALPFRELDFIVSCAPELIRTLQGWGVRAHHVHHAFDARVLSRLSAEATPAHDLTFAGQLVAGRGFHTDRQALLARLAAHSSLEIFTASFAGRGHGRSRWAARSGRALGRLVHGLVDLGFPASVVERVPKVRSLLDLRFNPAIRPCLRPPVYGMGLYEMCRRSRICLNVHPDSSREYASNMRLFEVTGVGSCLLTDWRPNLPSLFTPDREAVTYRSAAECIEKVHWLLAHPAEREAIARAGQQRCLAVHTHAHRAPMIDALIRDALASRAPVPARVSPASRSAAGSDPEPGPEQPERAPAQRTRSPGTGRDVVCLSSIDWNHNWQIHQRLATELARQGDRVLFVENTGVRTPTWRDARRVARRVVNWVAGPRPAAAGRRDDGLTIWAPVVLPWPYSRVATSINQRIIERRLRRWRHRDPSRDLIVWTFLPTPLAEGVIRALRPRLTIYYCVDDLASTSDAARRISETECTLLRTADLVLVTSQELRRHVLRHRQQVALLPSAVDVDLFEHADGGHGVPDDLRDLPRPLVGYVGGVKKWIDQDLMRAVARRLPNASFVLVGPRSTDVSGLSSVPNIHLVGARPHASIPGYLHAFDVALIPYRLTPYTAHVYPAKLLEYLATGRPIVSTSLPEIVRFESEYPGLVSIAADTDGFCAAVTEALASPDPDAARRRVELARANSWPVRFGVLSSLIEAALTATADRADRGAV